MKHIKMWAESNARLVFCAVISTVIGFKFLFGEKVDEIAIKAIGVYFLLDAFCYVLDLVEKYLKNKCDDNRI
jgi:hypothetical protein